MNESMNLEHNFVKNYMKGDGGHFTLNCGVCNIPLTTKTRDEICKFTTEKHYENIIIFNRMADTYERF